jgi:plastocyanin
MRRRIVLMALMALAAVAMAGAPAPASSGASVEIGDQGFEPARVEVDAGQTVQWRNASSATQTVRAADGSFDSGDLEPGDVYSITLEHPGTYRYTNGESRREGVMAGAVVVVPADEPGSDAGSTDDPGSDLSADETPSPVEAEPTGTPDQSSPTGDSAVAPVNASETDEARGAPVSTQSAGSTESSGSAAAGQASSATVQVVDNAFQPKQVEMDAGGTVVWQQTGELPHTVTADDGSFDSGEMGQGDTFSHTFPAPGTYPYYCEFHGAPGGQGMSGVVVVSGGETDDAADGSGSTGEDVSGPALADTGASLATLVATMIALAVAGGAILLTGSRLSARSR